MLSTYFRRTVKALRLRGPLSDDPTAQTLHTLLVALVGWLILEFTADLYVTATSRKPAAFAMMLIAVLFTLAPPGPSSPWLVTHGQLNLPVGILAALHHLNHPQWRNP